MALHYVSNTIYLARPDGFGFYVAVDYTCDAKHDGSTEKDRWSLFLGKTCTTLHNYNLQP